MKRVTALATILGLTVAGAAIAQPRGATPPPGDYFQSCRNVSTAGYGPGATMTAECRDERGRWRTSSLQFGGCDRIENRDGQLMCLRGGGPGGGGGGGGYPGRPPFGRGSQLTLFSGPRFSGEAFQTRKEITNLPKQFNDRAVSLRIEGRGAWQVCANSDFKGRCEVFDRDVQDLRPYGLAYGISSMRLAR
jgi:hypothetical protein